MNQDKKICQIKKVELIKNYLKILKILKQVNKMIKKKQKMKLNKKAFKRR